MPRHRELQIGGHRAPDIEALVDLAESDPRRTITDAERLRQDPRLGDREHAIALRAVGLAWRTRGRVAESVAAFEEGMRHAGAAGDDELLGEIELSLAPSLAFGGDLPGAFRMLDRADQHLEELGRAHVAVQRAGLLARGGDFAAALPLYAAAEPVLRANDDERWLALLGANRGLVHTYSGRFDDAQRDLEMARDLYESTGKASSSAEMVHNLAFLAMRKGDIPGALALYDEAEALFRALELNVYVVLMDRADALLMAGLATEARDLASAVEERLAAMDLEIERSEALLVEARAALAARDFDGAAEAARTARGSMGDQDRAGWLLRARYLEAAARFGLGDELDRTVLGELAKQLDQAGQPYSAYHCRLLAGRVALAQRDVATAHRELAQAGAAPAGAPVDIRVQAALARALLHRSRNDNRAAGAAIGSGFRLLESYRSTLGATESRLNVALHAAELYRLAVQAAVESGSPSRVLRWLERVRTGSLRAVDPLPPDDPDLARALSELRAVQMEARTTEVEGGISPGLWREQAQLEREVRRLTLRRGGSVHSPVELPTLRELQDRLGDREMLVLVSVGDRMIALRIRRTSIRMFDRGPAAPIASAAERLARAHRSAAVPASSRTAESHVRAAQAAAEELDGLLFEDLRLVADDLILVPPASLFSVPWSAVPTCARRYVSLAPSAFAWYRSATASRRVGSALLVAGPRLDHAASEVEAVADVYEESRVLTGEQASVGAVIDALGESGTVHFACHARFRAENPMFSSLVLADGDLNVYDLERLSAVPDQVVLSACDSGLSRAHAGDELSGLAAALLGKGARTIVAARAPVSDSASTVELMHSLHRGLRRGMGPVRALKEAGAATAARPAGDDWVRNSFFCIGT